MRQNTHTFTDHDVERLEEILDGAQRLNPLKRNSLEALAEELESGDIVPSRKIASDIITLNSRIRLRDLDNGKDLELTLALPASADFSAGRLSVTSPLGIAILGHAVGEAIEYSVQSGIKRVRIDEILYQPEAAGHYHL